MVALGSLFFLDGGRRTPSDLGAELHPVMVCSVSLVWPCMTINRQETCRRPVVRPLTVQPSLRCSRPLSPSACRQTQTTTSTTRRKRASREVPGFSQRYFQRQDCMDRGGGFPLFSPSGPT